MQRLPAVELKRLGQIEEPGVDRPDRAGGGLRGWRGHPRRSYRLCLRRGADRCMMRGFRRTIDCSPPKGASRWHMATVNNGVNVQALLDAREALKGAPEAAKFTWRASCKWKNGTHSKTTVESFFGLGQEQRHKTETSFDADHPEIFASEDQRDHADRIRPRRPGELPHRGRRGRRAESRHPAAIGRVAARRHDGHPRHSRRRQRRAERLRRHQGDVQDRRGRLEEGDRGTRRAVAEALGGVRRDHEPGERHRRSRRRGDTPLGVQGERTHRARHHRRDRRRPRRPRGEPVAHRPVDRSRRARARRGGELVAARALGLPAAPHAQLAEPSAGLPLRWPASRRLHDDGRGDRVHLALRQRLSQAPVRTSDERHVGDAYRRWVSRRDEQRRDRVPVRRGRERRLQPPERAGASQSVPASIEQFTAVRLPQSGAAARRRRARRRRVGDGRAAGRRDPAFRPARDALRRGARPSAAHVSRP